MNENIIKSKENRRKIYVSLLVTVICLIGLTYALFTIFLKQTENNSLATRTCFSTSLTEESSKITLEKAYPLTDEKGLETTPFTFKLTNNCANYVKAYITIDSTYRTSTSTSYLADNYIKANVSLKGGSIKKSVIIGKQKLMDIDNNKKGYIIDEILLKPNEEREYDLRLWIEQNVTVDQGLNKSWKGSLVVAAVAETPPSAPNGWYETEEGTLLANLRENNFPEETLTEPGKEVNAHTIDDIEEIGTSNYSSTYQEYYITYGTGWKANGTKFDLTGTAVTKDTYANSYSDLVGKYLGQINPRLAGSPTAGTMKTTTNFSSVFYIVSATPTSFTYKRLSSNKNTTEALLASTEDDYGTSYYFRGSVKNNYVEYANMCWRIVRVTGDGSIKLVLYNYNGLTSSNSKPLTSDPCNKTGEDYSFARFEGNTYESAFNSRYSDNAHIGFMNGTAGAVSYALAHTNTHASTILINLNKWYTNVLSKQSGFSDNQLADTIWCNDKSVVTDTTFNPGNWTTLGTNYGRAKNVNFYSTSQRLIQATAWSAGGTGPSLICPNDNNGGNLSKFTVDDTEYGNGALKNYAKIGLLTADEVTFAGGAYNNSNSTHYLKGNATSSSWWTLSPSYFSSGKANVWDVSNGGSITGGIISSSASLRPSLSLSSGVKITSGDGTAANPYKIAA